MTARFAALLSILALAIFFPLMVLAQAPAKSPAYIFPWRIVHFELRALSQEAARSIVDTAKDSGFNAIQVRITDGVALENAPWTPRKDAWSKKEFMAWVAYTRSRGMEIIPEVALLTHQELFLQGNQPGLMFNAVTYDPRKEETYRLALPLLDEIIDVIHPKIMHIGHDEVVGWDKPHAKKVLKPGEIYLPANLFLQDVLRLHDYLKAKGVDTWMWGDMLLSPDEFPSMLARHLHGGLPGYGKRLRDKLPKDIVICDWHYFDDQDNFQSLSVMQSEGFKVIGATWKTESAIRNFSRYARDNEGYGMMATTWFHVQKKQLEVVDWIIRSSGSLFQKSDAAIPLRPNAADYVYN